MRTYGYRVGQRQVNGWGTPRGYCEVSGANQYYDRRDVPLPNLATITYQFRYKDGIWTCRINDEVVDTWTLNQVGFAQGTWLPVQGESHGYHVQLGDVYPAKMRFDEIDYELAGSNLWQPVTLDEPNNPEWPYDTDTPAADVFRVWTLNH